ncbi:hypothetical protein ABB37_07323 [Leptomonas pyrrhocoris]|uniref:Uncharacterized protein n=1 Tax=Leptomonas pyrrhocoris TaxID=157538 RepID=A0A0M9FVR7_LEPPY|nr:hypothetical protein ABB37_07323 [Leptomonas pyrrhocoris]XP_015655387.1 hypothetical protein ABB37_07323 [Leptomonas pyrrhocoris]XP_015655388.1 hypothetical protein ABB37_07323 [Leptomonas pyrrhocoris]KPA76947.1 hypothetical protein ABB37_07323 [Leptomonas pyrrhocoris]KPA76948.1 hypothetical protein ABB37_07323 [Leptomonas pyrrhocoris]KPA76949.1 hypothetical protein ABB37_07323 [Leptomonas pyrrhocoris]|eukprot:XP_015655386.1 hypothetical protein ABB37_07323 [Leptomonas pyrrhocoris]
MKALVLCDGSEGSLRCIEVACAAPAKAASADTALVLLHVWDGPLKSPSAALAGEGASSHPATRSSRVSFSTHAAADAGSTAPDPSTNEAAAAVTASSSASLSCAEVLTATLKAVHTNKYVKGRAHYCVETVCAAAAAMTNENTADNSSYLVKATSDAAPDKSAALTSGRDEQEEAAQVNAVVRHASARAGHHQVEAVLLGVGQLQEGKVCAVGTVALHTLRHLRTRYPLYYIKKDGVKWRPAPAANATASATAAATAVIAPLRFTVVVPIPASITPSLPAGGSATDVRTTAEVPSSPVRLAIEAAVHYTQQHCWRTSSAAAASPTSVDSVAFLLIAPSSVKSEEGDSVPVGGEGGVGMAAAEANDALPEHGEASLVDLYKRYLETLLPKAAPVLAALEPQDEQGKVADTPAAGEKANMVSSDASPSGTPSRISVCALKASKKHPRVTLEEAEVALPQVLKHVSAVKPDVLVLPVSLIPDALQLAMLSASKPHCVILPY